MKKYLFIAILALLSISAVLLGLEYSIMPNPVGLRLASWMNLPSVRINDTVFSVRDLLADQKSVNTAAETKDLTPAQKTELVLSKMKQEGVINSLIKNYKLEINASDVAKLQDQLLRGADNSVLDEKGVEEAFGYSRADFTRRVAVPYYNRLQLQKYYILNTDNKDKETISGIRQRLVAGGSDFTTETRNLSGQDPVDHLISAKDLVGEYEHISKIPEGGFSGIIANSDGYRLYQVKHIIEDETDGTYYQLLELFVPTTIFQEKLNEAMATATEQWYIRKPSA